MSDEQGARSALAAALQQLLRGMPVDPRQGAYLEGGELAVLLDPYQSSEPDRFDLPVTVLPLAAPTARLAGLALVLRGDGGVGSIAFGRLNGRGQLCFHNLPAGAYSLQCHLPAAGALTSVALPRPQAAAASGPESPGPEIRAAGGQLAVRLLQRAAGELELHFAAPDRRWDGHVVIFSWSPSEEPAPGSSPRLCAPLTWSERDRACVAQLLLGDGAEARGLSLPEAPAPPQALADETAETLRASVAAAARAQTLRAWQRLLEERVATLPPDVVVTIGAALARRRDSY